MQLPRLMRELRSVASEGARQVLEGPLYALGIGAYALAARLYALGNRKAALMTKGQRRTWQKLREAVDPNLRWIWVHASSLGEFEQGRPLMERIRREFPDRRILLSFFSPSGYEVRKDFAGADCVVYLPFDTQRNARRFVEAVNPEMAVFVKYEFWRNYLLALRRRAVPTYLISAVFRPDQAFFKRRSAWYRHWLRNFTHIFVQDEGSRELLARFGFRDVTAAGDTRFDRVTDILRAARKIPELERFRASGKPVAMFGSSWESDEAVYLPWLNSHRGDVLAVIAPHEFNPRRLEALRGFLAGRTVLMSEARENPALLDGADNLVMDCFGLLSSAYAYADMAYVGGGFGAGLHNINEAAVYGIPVAYGPNNRKFIEARELRESGGGAEVADAAAFAAVMDRWLTDASSRAAAGEKAGAYIRSKLGATSLIFSRLFPRQES